MFKSRTRNLGTTLVELMAILAILAIGTTLASPALSDLLQAGKSRSARSALAVAINQARSAAVMQGRHTVMCPSSDQIRCDRGVEWQQGWLVFRDDDQNGERDPNEPLIAVAQAQANGIAIVSSQGRQRIRYRPNGTTQLSNLTLTVCDHRGPTEARALVINNSGRLRTGEPSSAQAARACAVLGL